MFITFEGPEGSGKSTVMAQVAEQLKRPVMVTREPGGVKIGEAIREILLDDHNTMDYRTEALLFAASRRQHLVEKVIPAVQQGTIVLCDRFVDSSLAYQGFARGIGVEAIRQINDFAIMNHYPDLTLYFKVDPAVGLARINDNDRDMNRLDKETLDFHKRVTEGYDRLAAENPERIVIIDASQPLDCVIADTLDIIISKLK